MNVPEMFSRNWEIKLLSLVIAMLIWYFITPATERFTGPSQQSPVSAPKSP